MSVFDELKGKAGQLKDKAAHLVGGNADKLKDGVGKAGDFIDSKTGGKYSGQVDGLQAKVANLIDRADGGNTPGAATDKGSPSA